MTDNEIISGICEARRAFAAEHGNDLHAIFKEAMKIALECGFKSVAIPSNPNFHYPKDWNASAMGAV